MYLRERIYLKRRKEKMSSLPSKVKLVYKESELFPDYLKD